MEDYDVFSEMQNLKSKKVIMFVEDDENYILNNFSNSNFELLPIRFSYDLSSFSNEYIEKTKYLFTYYYNQSNSSDNELLRLKKHFTHYQRSPFIAYVPQGKDDYVVLTEMLQKLKIECVDDKELFFKKATNSKKLILIDSDDTLRRSDGTISEKTKAAIAKNKQFGNKVVICTARPRYQTIEVMKESGADSFIISSNGAEIYDTNSKQIIFQSFIEHDDIIRFINYAYSKDIRLILTAEDFDYVTKDIRNSRQLLLDKENFLNQIENVNIKQCMFIDKKYGEIYKLKEIVKLNDKIAIVDEINENDLYEEKWFSIGNSNSSKGNALKILSNHLNIPIKNTIAIGNDKNDISMFNSCGFSVAVYNAPNYIKDMVDFVTSSNDEDGVAIALEKLIVQD